ncbi:hypothetical protein BC939DRAFT_442032 [Gamsiella multidivaricata]|uniref:uncharacterized protein n=1 Tax=Gamsiella multidivaricata TaxID=101098 RepID=UPI00221FEF38|nr:uncharacterized protein BC939DRAFT_442032 [Gamsiella multidivaricata]KAI7829475.1 hypothetical protein BC939DRAFT_442032 [Gamsiella multidivaricata]
MCARVSFVIICCCYCQSLSLSRPRKMRQPLQGLANRPIAALVHQSACCINPPSSRIDMFVHPLGDIPLALLSTPKKEKKKRKSIGQILHQGG